MDFGALSRSYCVLFTHKTSLVPRPCGGGKKRPGIDCLRMRGCPTICGGQDLYVYSPCNVGRYITCTLPHIVSRVRTKWRSAFLVSTKGLRSHYRELERVV